MPTSSLDVESLRRHPRAATLPGGGPPFVPDDPADFGDDGRPDDSRDDDPIPTRWITLATFLHPAEAHIVRLHIEAAGIACVLLDELTAGTHCLSLAVGGVKLQVPADDGPRARALLRGLHAEVDPVLARFEEMHIATMALCVIEAEHLAGRLRQTRAGSIELTSDEDDLPDAAHALALTPFAAALTDEGMHAIARKKCPYCDQDRSRIDLGRMRQRARKTNMTPLGPWFRRLLIQTIAARRCCACGERW